MGKRIKERHKQCTVISLRDITVVLNALYNKRKAAPEFSKLILGLPFSYYALLIRCRIKMFLYKNRFKISNFYQNKDTGQTH